MHLLRVLLAGSIGLGGLVSAASAGERSDYPAPARAHYDRGQKLLQEGRYPQAIDAFEEAMRQGMTDFPRAHLGLARSTLALKKYDSAIERYTRFIQQFGLEKSCRH